MKHPDDRATLELPGLEPKRGRGRPRKPDALTPAQRAKRYRDMKKLKAQADQARDRYRALLGRSAQQPGAPYDWAAHDLRSWLQGMPDVYRSETEKEAYMRRYPGAIKRDA